MQYNFTAGDVVRSSGHAFLYKILTTDFLDDEFASVHPSEMLLALRLDGDFCEVAKPDGSVGWIQGVMLERLAL